MSNDKARLILGKIIKHIDHTLEYTNEQTFESFMRNRMLQEACIFNILQVGELSKVGFDSEFIASHPEIEWNQMYGMRNRIAHDYEGLRMRIVWETISNDFPMLKEKLLSILSELS